MQHAGLQYGQGAANSHQSPPFATDISQTGGGNTTSSLRQFRKKDGLEKQQGADLSTSITENSHIARVPPHNHYPARPNDFYRYQPPQYPDYSAPYKEVAPVKYSEISEPLQQLQHVDHLPTALQKQKEKEFMDMCNISQQQAHMKQSYPDNLARQQNYPPDAGVHHQYLHKEPQQVHPGYKPESQYLPPKDPQYQQYPQLPKYTMPTQCRKYTPPENDFLAKLQRIHPTMARSIMSDHHIREQAAYPPTMDQNRMYPQNQRYHYQMQNNPPTYPHNYHAVAQPYNYSAACNYKHPDYSRPPNQMAPVVGGARYPPAMNPPERSVSPRRNYPDNMGVPMNYVPQKISPTYPQYNAPEYAQHYQHRRASMPQEYYQQPCRPSQYLTGHEISPEPADSRQSSGLRHYLENWAEEEAAAEIAPPPMEPNKYQMYKESMRSQHEEQPPSTEQVYVINSSEISPQCFEGISLVPTENGEYIIKNGALDTSVVRIINKEAAENNSNERAVNLQILETPAKPDCMLVGDSGKPVRKEETPGEVAPCAPEAAEPKEQSGRNLPENLTIQSQKSPNETTAPAPTEKKRDHQGEATEEVADKMSVEKDVRSPLPDVDDNSNAEDVTTGSVDDSSSDDDDDDDIKDMPLIEDEKALFKDDESESKETDDGGCQESASDEEPEESPPEATSVIVSNEQVANQTTEGAADEKTAPELGEEAPDETEVFPEASEEAAVKDAEGEVAKKFESPLIEPLTEMETTIKAPTGVEAIVELPTGMEATFEASIGVEAIIEKPTEVEVINEALTRVEAIIEKPTEVEPISEASTRVADTVEAPTEAKPITLEPAKVAFDPDLLNRVEAPKPTTTTKRTQRIFSVDDIINNIGKDCNKSRRSSLQITKDFAVRESVQKEPLEEFPEPKPDSEFAPAVTEDDAEDIGDDPGEENQSEVEIRNAISIEEDSVIIEIGGAFVQLNVNHYNGTKVLSVLPLSDSLVIDVNGNYQGVGDQWEQPRYAAKETEDAAAEKESADEETEDTVEETEDTVEEKESAVEELEDAVKETQAKITEHSVKVTEDAVKETDNVVKETEDAVKETDDAVQETNDSIKETLDALLGTENDHLVLASETKVSLDDEEVVASDVYQNEVVIGDDSADGDVFLDLVNNVEKDGVDCTNLGEERQKASDVLYGELITPESVDCTNLCKEPQKISNVVLYGKLITSQSVNCTNFDEEHQKANDFAPNRELKTPEFIKKTEPKLKQPVKKVEGKAAKSDRAIRDAVGKPDRKADCYISKMASDLEKETKMEPDLEKGTKIAPGVEKEPKKGTNVSKKADSEISSSVSEEFKKSTKRMDKPKDDEPKRQTKPKMVPYDETQKRDAKKPTRVRKVVPEVSSTVAEEAKKPTKKPEEAAKKETGLCTKAAKKSYEDDLGAGKKTKAETKPVPCKSVDAKKAVSKLEEAVNKMKSMKEKVREAPTGLRDPRLQGAWAKTREVPAAEEKKRPKPVRRVTFNLEPQVVTTTSRRPDFFSDTDELTRRRLSWEEYNSRKRKGGDAADGRAKKAMMSERTVTSTLTLDDEDDEVSIEKVEMSIEHEINRKRSPPAAAHAVSPPPPPLVRQVYSCWEEEVESPKPSQSSDVEKYVPVRVIDANEFNIKPMEASPVSSSQFSEDDSLQVYKEVVDSKLNSLNIHIPKVSKPKAAGSDDSDAKKVSVLIKRFLSKGVLNGSELDKVKKIIEYKRRMEEDLLVQKAKKQLTYEVRGQRDLNDLNDLKLHFRKVPPPPSSNESSPKRKRKRFRNLYADDTSEEEAEEEETGESDAASELAKGVVGDYSVFQRSSQAGVPKLIFKRKSGLPQPFVKLERSQAAEMLVKKRKFY